MIRLFFATDLHGSDVCWRKFLNAGRFYQANVLVLGGDMTGKALVPLIQQPDSTFKVWYQDAEHHLRSEEDVRNMEMTLANRGYYAFRTTSEQIGELNEDARRQDELFQQLMLERIQAWMDLADERLQGTDIRCYVCPGNDDHFEVDDIINRSSQVQLTENRLVELSQGFEMISTGWTNPTPWDTFREEGEAALKERIEILARQVRDFDRAIFNLHAPPYGSYLDDAPDLDKDLKPRHAGQLSVPVGSKAVSDVINEYQPLLSLHGHIHESRGAVTLGRTLSINPGSAYEQGSLLGAIVDLDHRKGVINHVLTSG